jgi:hypothetical protein
MDKITVNGKDNKGNKIFDIKSFTIDVVDIKWKDRVTLNNLCGKVSREIVSGEYDWADIGDIILTATALKEEDFDRYSNQELISIVFAIIQTRFDSKKKLKK